mgnify:FL=1|jgi:hypothetical protein
MRVLAAMADVRRVYETVLYMSWKHEILIYGQLVIVCDLSRRHHDRGYYSVWKVSSHLLTVYAAYSCSTSTSLPVIT